MKGRRWSWLRRLVWLAAGCLVLLVASYVYLTRPARLRAQVLRACASLPVEQVAVERVTFSPWGRLELFNVAFVLPGEPVGPSPGHSPEQRTRVRVARARVDCGLSGLLAGRLRPRSVVLDGVTVHWVCPSDGEAGLGPASADRDRQAELPWLASSSLPRVTLTQADVQLLVSGEGGTRLLRRWRVSGSGTPTDAGYELCIEPAEGAAKTLLTLSWNRGSGEIEAACGWLDVETALALAPNDLTDACRELDLWGRLRVDRAVFASAAAPSLDRERPVAPGWRLRAADLHLTELRCAVPIEETEDGKAAYPASQRFLQVRDADVRVHLDRPPDANALRVELAGTASLNGAPAEFRLAAEPAALGGPGFTVVSGELRASGVAFPTIEEHADFVTSPRLPRAIRNFFDDFRPQGRANLWWRVARRGGQSDGGAETGGKLSLEGEVEVLGAHCRYHKFPYDFAGVCGRVVISDAGIRLAGLTARHGRCRVRADGVVNHAGHNAGFDLVFHGVNTPLDADLFAALPAKYQRLWQQAAPLGVCEARVTVRREDGPRVGDALPTDVQVEARLIGASLVIDAGRRLRAAEGLITVGHNLLHIHDLHGYRDGAAVHLAGTIDVEGSGARTDLRVEAADLPIQRATVLDTGADQPAAEVRFSGRGDVWGRLRSGVQEDRYVVHLKDGVLSSFDPAQGWVVSDGWLRVSDDQSEVLALVAHQMGARLQASGALASAAGPARPLSLTIRIEEAPMERLVPQLLPQQWSQIADALGLAGLGTVTLQLQPDQSSGAPRQAAEVQLTAERMKPAPLPLGLREVRARGRVTAGGMELHEAQANQGREGQVRASGSMMWPEGRPQGEFRVNTERMDLTPELIDALPAAASRLLRRLAPKGQVRLDLDRMRFTGEHERTWDLAGRLAVKSGELELGLSLTEFDGQLNGTCIVHPDGEVDLDASFTIDHGCLAGRPVENWEGRLKRQAGERLVHLEDMRGRLCGGDAIGLVRVDPTDSTYELSLTFQDVSFAQLLPPKNHDGQPPRRGRVEGNIYLRGTANQPGSRKGGGHLGIRGGSFLQTPVLAEVAEASREGQRPIGDALDLMKLSFAWQGSLLRLTRVDIQSEKLRLVGHGTWDMDSDALDLTLLGAHPDHQLRLPVLTDLLESAGQELLQYRVRGTAAEPRVTVEPLHKLNQTLRALLEGEGERN